MKSIRKTAAIVAAVAAVLVSVVGGATALGAGRQQAAAAEIALGTHNTHYGDGSFEKFAGVIGWQEVESAAARTKLNNNLGAEYKTFMPGTGPASYIPISWRADRFTLVNSGSEQTHPGEAGVTPARYVNWVILELSGSGTRFIVVNTHFISGAWRGHPERQARWNTHYGVLKDRVAALRQSHPEMPLFVMGDFNRALAMDLPNPVKHVAVQGVDGTPIDQMYAPTNITHSQVTREPMWGSDHHAYRMTANI